MPRRRRPHVEFPPAATQLSEACRDDLAAELVPVATALACATRSSAAEVEQVLAEFLSECSWQDVVGLLVVLAGMVDVDQPVSELLGWCDPITARRRRAAALTDAELRAAHSRVERWRVEVRRGNQPPPLSPRLMEADREYQRRRHQRRVAAAS